MEASKRIVEEQQILETAARAVGFKYHMYVLASPPHRSGLLFTKPDSRTGVWNPLVDDADLPQLAVAAPTVNLQTFIVEAAKLGSENSSRLAYLREAFTRAVTLQTAGQASHRTIGYTVTVSSIP
jgi:hypothetical protein